ncbi:hypothetical protein [Demequina salsinemoris]|uniref:hypothetical protein n=1 Tax=Demequina salsinemoris TaxID=577470 RepID=UPI000784ACEA|nr:hypothetical protein [Demequina salsinemoris]
MRAWLLGVLVAIAGVAVVATLFVVLTGGDEAEVSPSPSPSASISSTVSPTPSDSPTATPSTASATPTASASPSPSATAAASPEETSDDPAKTGVEVSLTRFGVSDGELTAAAVVVGVVEEGGTCTLVVTDADQQLSVDGPGNASATTTDCAEGLSLDVSALTGPAILWIEYDSTSSYGTSDTAEIDLP